MPLPPKARRPGGSKGAHPPCYFSTAAATLFICGPAIRMLMTSLLLRWLVGAKPGGKKLPPIAKKASTDVKHKTQAIAPAVKPNSVSAEEDDGGDVDEGHAAEADGPDEASDDKNNDSEEAGGVETELRTQSKMGARCIIFSQQNHSIAFIAA